MKTIICDIDGTLIEHTGNLTKQICGHPPILKGVLEKFAEWDHKGYNIIFITGRRESLRSLTEKMLKDLGLFYDQLIMGVGPHQRVLINDMKPDSDEPMAVAVNVERNKGFEGLDI